MSGIALTSERIGFEAARLLDRLMHGESPPPGAAVAGADRRGHAAIDRHVGRRRPDLARAVAFIRSHATDPIQVSDVLREVPVSRRWLERRFREVLGRGPAAEIRRVRLSRAKRLLAETDMPVPEVARLAGFGSREYLAAVFAGELASVPANTATARSPAADEGRIPDGYVQVAVTAPRFRRASALNLVDRCRADLCGGSLDAV